MKRIALIGSAPSSVHLAPHLDTTWSIWACSPGAAPHLKRCDVFFEIHLWEPHQSWFAIDYRTFLANLQCPVYMIEHIPEVPKSVPYPKDAMLAKYGPWFFTSSLSWMLALAIEQKPDEIGLWGVDMSAQEEWEFQRSGCHYFIEKARSLGIKVTIPPESDLLRPPTLYGFREADPMHIKLMTRDKELKEHVVKAEADLAQARDRYWFFKGALDNNTYQLKTWVADAKAIEMAYANPVVQSLSAVEPEAPAIEVTAPIQPKPRKGPNGAHVGGISHG